MMWSVDLMSVTIAGWLLWIFITVCCYCKYYFTHDLQDKSAKATGACLLIMITTYGPMQAVWVDGGPEFEGAFADVCDQYG